MEQPNDNINVLIVEDLESTGFLLQEALRRCKGVFSVVHCKRLSEALQELKERAYNIILLDLNLPPESFGIDTVRIVREHTDLPIIVLTGADIDDQEFKDYNIADIFRKPSPDIDFLIYRIIIFGGGRNVRNGLKVLGNKTVRATNVFRAKIKELWQKRTLTRS